MEVIWFIGIFFCPIFTLGGVLMHYDHAVLGIIAMVVSLIVGGLNSGK
jgi:hypothetical protein